MVKVLIRLKKTGTRGRAGTGHSHRTIAIPGDSGG